MASIYFQIYTHSRKKSFENKSLERSHQNMKETNLKSIQPLQEQVIQAVEKTIMVKTSLANPVMIETEQAIYRITKQDINKKEKRQTNQNCLSVLFHLKN